MKYAIRYNKTFRHYDTIDEVIFPYKEDIVTFIPSILKGGNQKVILDLANCLVTEDIIQKIQQLKEQYNIEVMLDYPFEMDMYPIPLLQEKGIKFFFRDYAKSFSFVAAMVKLGACEVYIAEDLCFNLKQLQWYRKEKDVKIRVWPDVAQSPFGCPKVLPPLTQFFIRPEDMDLYENLFDVAELFHIGSNISAVYEIYKSGQWLGRLDLLILSLDTPIQNTKIVPYFGQQRIKCNKRCTYNICDICDLTEDFSKKLDEVNISITRERKPMDIPPEIQKMVEEKEYELAVDA